MANSISEDLRMTKGIALGFKQRFNGVDELKIQDKKKGDVAILKRGNRYIYYLIVKSRCFDKPTYQDLELSLQAMREHCRTYYVKELAIPKIGSGMNKMKWNRVSQIIKDTFKGTDISITIYSYDRPIHQHSVDPNADTL